MSFGNTWGCLGDVAANPKLRHRALYGDLRLWVPAITAKSTPDVSHSVMIPRITGTHDLSTFGPRCLCRLPHTHRSGNDRSCVHINRGFILCLHSQSPNLRLLNPQNARVIKQGVCIRSLLYENKTLTSNTPKVWRTFWRNSKWYNVWPHSFLYCENWVPWAVTYSCVWWDSH